MNINIERTGAAAQQAPDFPVLQEAAEWFALLRAEDASKADRQRWCSWLEAAPAHREAWRKVEAVNEQFNILPGTIARDALNAKSAQRRKLTKRLAMLCLVSSVGGLLTTRAPRTYLAALNAQYRTEVGAVRQVTLADGTQLWLNTDSAVDTEYSDGLRRIILHRGEVLIQTSSDQHNPKRPLAVDSRDGRMHALGTRFTVRLEAQTTRLAVLQSAVRIEPAHNAMTQVIAAGNEVRFGEDWIGTPTATDANTAAWSRHLLLADNMRLGDFLAELSRYRRGYLGCAPEVADLRLVGVYPLNDTDRILNALAASLPINVRRILPWWISIEAAA